KRSWPSTSAACNRRRITCAWWTSSCRWPGASRRPTCSSSVGATSASRQPYGPEHAQRKWPIEFGSWANATMFPSCSALQTSSFFPPCAKGFLEPCSRPAPPALPLWQATWEVYSRSPLTFRSTSLRCPCRLRIPPGPLRSPHDGRSPHRRPPTVPSSEPSSTFEPVSSFIVPSGRARSMTGAEAGPTPHRKEVALHALVLTAVLVTLLVFYDDLLTLSFDELCNLGSCIAVACIASSVRVAPRGHLSASSVYVIVFCLFHFGL